MIAIPIRKVRRCLAALLARRARLNGGAGMATAEYAIGTLAAVAFAVLLYKVATSPQIVAQMANLFNGAFKAINPGALTGLH